MTLDEYIQHNEGKRLRAYPDPLTGGAPWTIGFGHTHGVKEGDVWTDTECLAVYSLDRNNAISTGIKLYGLPLDVGCLTANYSPRYAALVDMCFNMGYVRLSRFVSFNADIRAKKYGTASEDLRGTLYAKEIKERAYRNAFMIGTDKWPVME